MNTLSESEFKPYLFFTEFADTYLHGDLLNKEEDAAPNILFLHDENRASNRSDFRLLRQLLFNQYDLSSCAFDFIGHGVTSGEWTETSLEERTKQTLDIVDSSFDCQPFSIVTMGLSAFTALKVVSLTPVSNLIFISPLIPQCGCTTAAFGQLSEQKFLETQHNVEYVDALASFLEFHGNIATIQHSSNSQQHCIDNNPRSREHYAMTLPKNASELVDFAQNKPVALSNIAKVIFNTCSSHS